MKNVTLLGLSAVACLGASTAYSQVNTTEGAYVANHGRVNAVNERETAAETKIAAGVQSGQIGAQQAADFKRRLNEIQADKTSDMMRRHGHLSKSSARELKREEDELDREIDAAMKKS